MTTQGLTESFALFFNNVCHKSQWSHDKARVARQKFSQVKKLFKKTIPLVFITDTDCKDCNDCDDSNDCNDKNRAFGPIFCDF